MVFIIQKYHYVAALWGVFYVITQDDIVYWIINQMVSFDYDRLHGSD